VHYRLAGRVLRLSVQHTFDRVLGGVISLRVMHHFDIDDSCSLLEVDLIELVVVVVAAIEVIPHSLVRLKTSMIFARLSFALEAIPDVAVAIRGS